MTACPHCEQTITGVDGEPMDARIGGRVFHVIAYSCPQCHAALGVEMDPLRVSDATAEKIATLLRDQWAQGGR